MIKPTNAADVILNAIEALETFGWTKNDYQNQQTGAVCALGALTIATVDNGVTSWDVADDLIHGTEENDYSGDEALKRLNDDARNAVSQALSERKGRNPYLVSIASFNDQEASSPQDVIDLFKEALSLVEEGRVTYDGSAK